MSDSWQFAVTLVAAVLIAYAVILWLGMAVWTYRDIRQRTRDGATQTLSVVLVLVLSIPGLFLYLLLRPNETLAEAYERRLEAEAFKQEFAEQRRSCPSCQRPIREDFLLCPYCRAKLQEQCIGCGRGLELTWAACPYCGATGPRTAAQAAAAAGPPPLPDQPPPAMLEQRRPAVPRPAQSASASRAPGARSSRKPASAAAASRESATAPSPSPPPTSSPP